MKSNKERNHRPSTGFFNRETWGMLFIILGVTAWFPYLYLLNRGDDPPFLTFLSAHLIGVLIGGWLRSSAPGASKPGDRNLRLLSRMLIYLGVLAWAPYFYLTRVNGLEADIAPFLAAHLTGVLSGFGLRLYLQFR